MPERCLLCVSKERMLQRWAALDMAVTRQLFRKQLGDQGPHSVVVGQVTEPPCCHNLEIVGKPTTEVGGEDEMKSRTQCPTQSKVQEIISVWSGWMAGGLTGSRTGR